MRGQGGATYTPRAMARAKKTTKKSTRAEEGADSATGVETLLEELDAVVNELEQGELPLEQALERFERGVTLARQSHQALDAMEQRVERLIADRGELALEDEDGDGDDDL